MGQVMDLEETSNKKFHYNEKNWISIKKCLPKNKETHLVKWSDKWVDRTDNDWWNYPDEKGEFWDTRGEKKITHWMPEPLPLN